VTAVRSAVSFLPEFAARTVDSFTAPRRHLMTGGFVIDLVAAPVALGAHLWESFSTAIGSTRN
jgi:hypothetical protein